MRSVLFSPNVAALIIGRSFRVDDPQANVNDQPRVTVRPTAKAPMIVIGEKQVRAMEKNNRFAEQVRTLSVKAPSVSGEWVDKDGKRVVIGVDENGNRVSLGPHINPG